MEFRFDCHRSGGHGPFRGLDAPLALPECSPDVLSEQECRSTGALTGQGVWPAPYASCSERQISEERMESRGLHSRIHAVVSRIPRGRVATYGQVARIAGIPNQARLVGYALHALPADTTVPWQRVVNAKGELSTPAGHDMRQRQLLEREGIRFDARGRIDLASWQWRPRARRAV